MCVHVCSMCGVYNYVQYISLDAPVCVRCVNCVWVHVHVCGCGLSVCMFTVYVFV